MGNVPTLYFLARSVRWSASTRTSTNGRAARVNASSEYTSFSITLQAAHQSAQKSSNSGLFDSFARALASSTVLYQRAVSALADGTIARLIVTTTKHTRT